MKISWTRKRTYSFLLVDPHTLVLPSDIDKSVYSSDFLNGNEKLSNFGAWEKMVKDDYFYIEKEKILENLIGITGMQRATRKDFKKYKRFLNFIKSRFSLGSYFNAKIKQRPILLADLGTVIDLSIIDHFHNINSNSNILEIGGGYGRLAGGFAANGNFNSYNLVDVVPSSLSLAEIYLNGNHLNVHKGFSGSYSMAINLLNLDDLSDIPAESMDLVINLESFQEMTQDWVDFWIKIINSKTKSNSYFYHSNSYGYKNFFELNLGESWKLISVYDHPRHWTNEHRTEVWRRD
jgi:putative sugar O-methyltransferase